MKCVWYVVLGTKKRLHCKTDKWNGSNCAIHRVALAAPVCWRRRGKRKWNLAKARRSHDNDVYVPHRIFNNDANFALTFVMTGLLTISKILLTFKALFIKENCQISASFMRISAARRTRSAYTHIVLNTIRQLDGWMLERHVSKLTTEWTTQGVTFFNLFDYLKNIHRKLLRINQYNLKRKW